MIGKVPPQIVIVNFPYAVFSVLDFLILQDGTDRLSQNNWCEITTLCCKISC